MEKQMIIDELKRLSDKYESDKINAIKLYIDLNNPYKVGDLFTDHIGTIRITNIRYYRNEREQEYSAVYKGIEVKKDGTNKKGNPIREAYQMNELKNKTNR